MTSQTYLTYEKMVFLQWNHRSSSPLATNLSHRIYVFLVFVNEFPFGIRLTVASIYSSLFSFSMFLVACAHTIDLNINCHSIALKPNSRTVAWRRTAHANVCDLLFLFIFLYQSAHFASICEKCVMLLLCIQVPYMYIDIHIT